MQALRHRWWGREENTTRQGDRVAFRLSDVFFPTAEQLFKPFPQGSEVEGTIINFSDSGLTPRAFAVIEVVEKHTVIVPVTELKVIKTDD